MSTKLTVFPIIRPSRNIRQFQRHFSWSHTSWFFLDNKMVGIGPIIVSEIYAVRRKNASSCYLTWSSCAGREFSHDFTTANYNETCSGHVGAVLNDSCGSWTLSLSKTFFWFNRFAWLLTMRVKTLRNVHFCSKYLVQTFMTLIWYFIFAWIPIVAFICIKECVVAIIGLHVQ